MGLKEKGSLRGGGGSLSGVCLGCALQHPPTPFCSLFIRKSEPPGLWARLGYLAFSLASSAFTGLAFFSCPSCGDDKHNGSAPAADAPSRSPKNVKKRTRLRPSQQLGVFFAHARGSSGSALLRLAQISVFSVNITTAPTGLAAEEVEKSRSSDSNLTTPPGVTTADERPETKEAVANTSPAASEAKLVIQVPVMSSPTPAIWVKRTHPVSVRND